MAAHRWKMDGFDSLSASEKAEATELQRMIAIEQQKAQFQAQVRAPTANRANMSFSMLRPRAGSARH